VRNRRLISDHDAVREVVRAINDHWAAKRYDEIGRLVLDEAVIAVPGFGSRICGRGEYVRSYRTYDETVETREFLAEDAEVDVMGDVAVAVSRFRVVYVIGKETHRETGHDILVLSRSNAGWKVAWRTMQVADAEVG